MAGMAKRISRGFKDEHPDVPWERICEMGDTLLRTPDRVSPDELWKHARAFIPELLLKTASLLEPKRDDQAGA